MTTRRRRRPTVVQVRTLLAIAACACAALLAATAAAAAPPPTQIIGTWTRTVSKADVLRAHATRIKPGSKWKLVITERKSVASSPGVRPFAGQFTPETAVTVSLSVGDGKYNLYSWRRVGDTLRFQVQKDDNANRRAVLDGLWAHRSR
jgi:opacity protein-like surface antigen